MSETSAPELVLEEEVVGAADWTWVEVVNVVVSLVRPMALDVAIVVVSEVLGDGLAPSDWYEIEYVEAENGVFTTAEPVTTSGPVEVDISVVERAEPGLLGGSGVSVCGRVGEGPASTGVLMRNPWLS